MKIETIYNELIDIMKNDMDFTKALKLEEKLEGDSPDIDFVKAEIDKFLSNPDLMETINQSKTDSINGLDKLVEERDKYSKVVKNLNDRNMRKSTGIIMINGKPVSLKDNDGNIVDFTIISF